MFEEEEDSEAEEAKEEEETVDVETEAAAETAAAAAAAATADEAFGNPVMPDLPVPTGPALDAVIVKITCLSLQNGGDKKQIYPNATLELRLFRGKKGKVNILLPPDDVSQFPRKQILFDFHSITALELPTEATPELVFDFCIVPDFKVARGRKGRAKFEENENQDFTEDSVATTCKRWAFTVPQNMIEKINHAEPRRGRHGSPRAAGCSRKSIGGV